MNDQDQDSVLLSTNEGVATVTLNRPARRNALDPAMAVRLVDVCDEIDADRSIGAVVITGAGGTFCSGANRTLLEKASEDPARADNYEALGSVYQAFMRVGALKAPVVCAVRGSAVGAGLNLVMAGDLRIVATDARLIAGFLRIGIHPGGGSFKLMSQLAGREAAAALAIFGEEIDGVRAAELGLAWQAVPDSDVEMRANEVARRAAIDPELSRLATKTFRAHAGHGIDWEVAMEAERSSQIWSLRRRFEAASSTQML
jgi:enoyl-CoA hydratase